MARDSGSKSEAPSESDERIPASENTDEKDTAESDKELIETARSRFKLALDAERENRTLAADDRRFRKGDQWPEAVKMAREAKGRPCLTINKMPQFEQQITNDQRQNRPAIKVHPVDDDADEKTAKVFQGVIKNIEVTSAADTARDTAFENAVRGGYGFYRIVTEYADPASFKQEIRVKRIRDPDTVYLDPNHLEPDGSDTEWGFIFERKPKDQYCSEHGESALAKATDWPSEVNSAPDWIASDSVLVAEYFYRSYEAKEIVLLSDGRVMEKRDAADYIKAHAAQAQDLSGQPMQAPAPAITIIKSRTARIPSIKWCKLNGLEVLSKTDWPGQWIPILPVYGAELVVDGKLIRESLIRHAKDPARMYNFWKSCETEAITLAPKSPFVAAVGQIEGFQALWESANRENHAYLPYNPKSENGTLLPPPQRQNTEANVQAVTQASMLAADEVKACLGLYDASLGAQSNETSGIAIQRRNNQAQTGNFHFTDNLNRTIRHEGRIIVDLIPHIYDTADMARIIGEDGEHDLVPINQEFKDDSGEMVTHDLSVGKYDVTIDTGPSYATRREESAEFMQNMVKAYPQTMQVAGDLVLKSMDVPGASELADRFKKTLDPKLLDDPKNQQIPPAIQAQMQSQGQMIDQLTGKVHALHDVLDQKKLELESKERIEFAKLDTQLKIALAQIDAKDSIALLNHQIGEIENRMSLLKVALPIGADPAQGAQPQDQGQGPQVSAPVPAGAPGADAGPGAPNPTGGEPPGPTMEQAFDGPNAN